MNDILPIKQLIASKFVDVPGPDGNPVRLTQYMEDPTGDPICPAIVIQTASFTGAWPVPPSKETTQLNFTVTIVVGPKNAPHNESACDYWLVWARNQAAADRSLSGLVNQAALTHAVIGTRPFGDSKRPYWVVQCYWPTQQTDDTIY